MEVKNDPVQFVTECFNKNTLNVVYLHCKKINDTAVATSLYNYITDTSVSQTVIQALATFTKWLFDVNNARVTQYEEPSCFALPFVQSQIDQFTSEVLTSVLPCIDVFYEIGVFNSRNMYTTMCKKQAAKMYKIYDKFLDNPDYNLDRKFIECFPTCFTTQDIVLYMIRNDMSTGIINLYDLYPEMKDVLRTVLIYDYPTVQSNPETSSHDYISKFINDLNSCFTSNCEYTDYTKLISQRFLKLNPIVINKLINDKVLYTL